MFLRQSYVKFPKFANSIAVVFSSIFENGRFYANLSYRQPYLIPPDIPLRNLPLVAL